VGYFVLGPSDLYKLVKEIGKFLQNIRTLGSDLSTTFENNMESSLQLEELRKAQRELNDAFSFRRSINVDADSEAFSVQAGSAQKAEAMAAMASTAVAVDPNAPPKKIRRRIRKKAVTETETPASLNYIPDLEMPEMDLTKSTINDEGLSDEEAAIIEAEFNQYVKNPFEAVDNWNAVETAPTTNSNTTIASMETDPVREQAARNRFQQQLSGGWNDQILSAGDKLEPIALVMNKIALLEQEKAAALKRLEEEFAKRTELEEKYYKEQRKLLEEAVSEVQSAAFGLDAKTKV
jgi:Sec-independent protein translocase protein TatA